MTNFDLSSAEWFKSSYSESGGQCVEVAWLPDGRIGVRDSKNPTGPALVYTPGEWDVFTAGVVDGRFVERATEEEAARGGSPAVSPDEVQGEQRYSTCRPRRDGDGIQGQPGNAERSPCLGGSSVIK